MLSFFVYHYFLAHGIQYCIHYSIHQNFCPFFIAREHSLHHAMPHKITWYGNPTVEKGFGGIYFVAFVLYTLHILFLYKEKIKHLCVFSIISFSFLTFHGMCHYLKKETQNKIPFLNILFFHHYKHHIKKDINFGFGDFTYDFLFGTLDLTPIELNKESEKAFDKKYFIHSAY